LGLSFSSYFLGFVSKNGRRRRRRRKTERDIFYFNGPDWNTQKITGPRLSSRDFVTKLDLLGKLCVGLVCPGMKQVVFIGRLSAGVGYAKLGGQKNKKTNEVGWSCQSGPISRKMTAYACAPFTFIFWRAPILSTKPTGVRPSPM
jgi:hypothetical protein